MGGPGERSEPSVTDPLRAIEESVYATVYGCGRSELLSGPFVMSFFMVI